MFSVKFFWNSIAAPLKCICKKIEFSATHGGVKEAEKNPPVKYNRLTNTLLNCYLQKYTPKMKSFLTILHLEFSYQNLDPNILAIFWIRNWFDTFFQILVHNHFSKSQIASLNLFCHIKVKILDFRISFLVWANLY